MLGLEVAPWGTACGSLAHADRAAELPALALALDAELVAEGPGGRRVIPAERFFVTSLTTDLGTDEFLAEVRFPLGGEATGWGFQELSRRFGDYAMAVAATVLVTASDGTIAKARIALAGVADRAVRAREAEALLVGTPGAEDRFAEAARVATVALTPPVDMHGSSAYRRHLAGGPGRACPRRRLGRARPRGAWRAPAPPPNLSETSPSSLDKLVIRAVELRSDAAGRPADRDLAGRRCGHRSRRSSVHRKHADRRRTFP